MDALSELTIPNERIVSQIHVIRGKKVMLDRDLAELYGVTTGRLNESVKRNSKRFSPAGRSGIFDIAIWDIKKGARWPAPISTLRVHRAWRRHVLKRLAERPGDSDQPADHQSIYSDARTLGDERNPSSKT